MHLKVLKIIDKTKLMHCESLAPLVVRAEMAMQRHNLYAEFFFQDQVISMWHNFIILRQFADGAYIKVSLSCVRQKSVHAGLSESTSAKKLNRYISLVQTELSIPSLTLL